MNPLNPTPQEQEEKRGEGAQAVASEEDRKRVRDYAETLDDRSLESLARAFQAVLTDAETLARSSSSPASSDTETRVETDRERDIKRVAAWAVASNNTDPDLRQAAHRLLARDPAPEPPPVSGGTRAESEADRG